MAVVVFVRLLRKCHGRAALYLDDLIQPAAVIDGPNMHNDFQHYLKLGMYRHSEIATDNWIYLDDLTIITLTAR